MLEIKLTTKNVRLLTADESSKDMGFGCILTDQTKTLQQIKPILTNGFVLMIRYIYFHFEYVPIYYLALTCRTTLTQDYS